MKTRHVDIKGPNGDYRVEIGPGTLEHVGSQIDTLFSGSHRGGYAVVTDKTVGGLYAEAVRTSLASTGRTIAVHSIPAGEASKSVDELMALFAFLAKHRVGRDGLVIALGGGVVSDLAGFAAATWMRGIPWIVVPTTLESQIDASIGGKTAINIPGGKNLVGAFHKPKAVLIDPTCLKTLRPRDVAAGLAESIKHALISSPDFLTYHEQHVDAVLALDDTVLTELIERNVRVKAGVVERDPFEQTGERMTLNFGHTIGHAIEANCGFTLRHGECVALGIVAACRLSKLMGLLTPTVVDRVPTLLSRYQLPITLSEPIPFELVWETIARDKKSRGQQVRWVLLESIGRTRISTNVDEHAVREAYESLFEPGG